MTVKAQPTSGGYAPLPRLDRLWRRRVLMIEMLVLLCAVLAVPTLAVLPGERLADPVLEARARALGQELRCLVCQNQSIDDSNADLAHDLRVLVRERLVAGDSDKQVLAYLTNRYGDYVLLRPPVKPTTWLLWFGPPLLLVAGGLAILLAGRRRRADVLARPAPLSAAEQVRLARLMKEGG